MATENNSSVLLKVAILVQLRVLLAADGQDGSGLHLEKVGTVFQVVFSLLHLRKISKNYTFFLFEN